MNSSLLEDHREALLNTQVFQFTGMMLAKSVYFNSAYCGTEIKAICPFVKYICAEAQSSMHTNHS